MEDTVDTAPNLQGEDFSQEGKRLKGIIENIHIQIFFLHFLMWLGAEWESIILAYLFQDIILERAKVSELLSSWEMLLLIG